MRERGELSAAADPNDLALATLAALEGGLLLSQVRRSTAPLEQALDRMLDHIESYRTPYPEQPVIPTPGVPA
jgi:hypothetical protein